ncbi:MAG: hypothetical protein ABIO63_02925, partial [Casimicrobiaceae bacterium]
FDLVREFVQELPRSTATESWHRAVLLARATEIDPDRESRVKISKTDTLKADHPFFWAGYLLVDRDSGIAGDLSVENPGEKKDAPPAKDVVPPRGIAPPKPKPAAEADKEAEPAKEAAPAKAPPRKRSK